MATKELKILIDYTNYINECVSNNAEINKDTIREYLKGNHYYTPIK